MVHNLCDPVRNANNSVEKSQIALQMMKTWRPVCDVRPHGNRNVHHGHRHNCNGRKFQPLHLRWELVNDKHSRAKRHWHRHRLKEMRTKSVAIATMPVIDTNAWVQHHGYRHKCDHVEAPTFATGIANKRTTSNWAGVFNGALPQMEPKGAEMVACASMSITDLGADTNVRETPRATSQMKPKQNWSQMWRCRPSTTAQTTTRAKHNGNRHNRTPWHHTTGFTSIVVGVFPAGAPNIGTSRVKRPTRQWTTPQNQKH